MEEASRHQCDISTANVYYLSNTTEVSYMLQARGLFPATAARTVWDRLFSSLKLQNSPESLSAAVKLLIFFPHQAIGADRSIPWNEWAHQAIELWRPMANNVHWNGVWMCFLARLAKHDRFVCYSAHPLSFAWYSCIRAKPLTISNRTCRNEACKIVSRSKGRTNAAELHAVSEVWACVLQGLIDWPTILPHVCSRAGWLFNVHVGNAAAPHLNNIPPRHPIDQVAFIAVSRGTSAISHLAKILMCTLRSSPQLSQPPRTLNALEGVQQIVTLFEHFFHASNVGPYVHAEFSLPVSSWFYLKVQ